MSHHRTTRQTVDGPSIVGDSGSSTRHQNGTLTESLEGVSSRCHQIAFGGGIVGD